MDEGPNVKESRVPHLSQHCLRGCAPIDLHSDRGVNSNSLELFAIDRPGIVGYYCLKKLAVCPPAAKALNVRFWRPCVF